MSQSQVEILSSTVHEYGYDSEPEIVSPLPDLCLSNQAITTNPTSFSEQYNKSQKILVPFSETTLAQFSKQYEQTNNDFWNNEPIIASRRSRSRSRSRSTSRKERKLREIELKPWNISRILPGSTIAFAGKRMSGKSNSARAVLTILNPPRIVFFGKGGDKEEWQKFVKPIYIFEQWNEAKFLAILNFQSWLTKLVRKPGNEHLNIDLAIVLEDMSSDSDVMKSPAIAHLVSNGRRLRTLFLCSAQYLRNLKSNVRTQIDYFCLFKEKAQQVREFLNSLVGGHYESKATFLNLLDEITVDRRFMVVNTSSDKNDEITDFTNFYKVNPDDLGKKELGSLLYRMFNELYYKDPDEDEDEEPSKTPEAIALLPTKQPKIVIPDDVTDAVPTEDIRRHAEKDGVFEVRYRPGKEQDHLISFCDPTQVPPSTI